MPDESKRTGNSYLNSATCPAASVRVVAGSEITPKKCTPVFASRKARNCRFNSGTYPLAIGQSVDRNTHTSALRPGSDRKECETPAVSSSEKSSRAGKAAREAASKAADDSTVFTRSSARTVLVRPANVQEPSSTATSAMHATAMGIFNEDAAG